MFLFFLLLGLASPALGQGFVSDVLKNIGKISSPPPIQPEEWDGLEFRYGRVVFRPAQFKIEAAFLGFILVYAVVWLLGRRQNHLRAMAWFDAHKALLETQFSNPLPKTGLIVQDGPRDFFNYSTGRRGLRALHTTAQLRPRQDALSMLIDFCWTLYDLKYTPKDEIQLDFTLQPSSGTPGLVWAIIKKDEMTNMRRERFDLGFTKGAEFAGLPDDVYVFSEAADITESLLKYTSNLPLAKLLHSDAAHKYFRSLFITDQPAERPEGVIPASERFRHVILTLDAPPPSDAAATIPLVEICFALIDVLDSKLPLRPETKLKLKTRREEVEEELKKEARKEKDDEQEENKRLAKKKAEEEKLARLSATEQKKFEEKERKKALRRQQGKLVSRK
ncbi:hypothetical protein Clacol_001670 [Clathrus columnatus]|uniref:DUF1682-domain-containing protein n=1 Tax=Clathrus columnatus TaxID=1419009 RepID=A0AAV5A492_9AGAM|nr:hypothetical protein Clacol_001670 [Clathrus columnatus]